MKIFIFSLLLLSFLIANSTEQKQMTLSDCIRFAQLNSPIAKVSKNLYESRKLHYKAFTADLLPQLSMQGSIPGMSRSILPVVQPDGSTLFKTQSQLFSIASLNLSQKIPWTNTYLNFSSGINRIDFLGDPKTQVWSTSPIQVSLTQPLFQFNTMAMDSKIEDLKDDMSQRQYAEDMEDLAITITQKFFDLFILQMNVKNAELNVAINDTLYKLSINRFKVGKIAENDLLQSELQLLNTKNQLESSRLDLRRSLEDLIMAIGMEKTDSLIIEPPIAIPNITIEPELAIRLATQNRSDFVNYDILELQSQRDIESAKSNNRFNANINASYGVNKSASQLPVAYKELLDQETFNITFSIPLFQWGKGSAQVESAISAERSTKTNIENKKRSFELDLKYEALSFNQLQQQLKTSAKADTIAQRRFDVAKNRYIIGKIDLTAFFIAQSEKDNAFTSFIQMQKNFWIAYYRLRRLTLYDFEKRQNIYYKY
jgi:outer membrane protein TolC